MLSGMMRKILGIDVSKDRVTACILTEQPDELKRFARTNKFPVFKSDREGVRELLSLDFDGAVLEPTGSYSKFWEFQLKRHGKEVRYVSGRIIKVERERNRVTNKSDNFDAAAIALYGFQNWDRPSAFIQGNGAELRELFLQLNGLKNLRSTSLNRLKTQLSTECPEVQDFSTLRIWGQKTNNVLKVLADPTGTTAAGTRRKIESSVGTGISQMSRAIAKAVIELDNATAEIENEVDVLLKAPEYEPYLRAFERMKMVGTTRLCLLSYIYPFERFLNEDRKQIIERVNGSKRYVSLGAFKLAIGVGKTQMQSGGKQIWKAGGSKICRNALYLWAQNSVIKKPDLDNPHIAELHSFFKKGSTIQKSEDEEIWINPGIGNQRIMKVVSRASKKLFKELLAEIGS